jgi:glycosyltransferase involved in cell wall biosynthesis
MAGQPMSFVSRLFGADDERAASPRIYIDLTDLVGHVIWHATGAGIQRVQLEIATALVHSDPNVVPFSLYDDTWRDLRGAIEAADGDRERLFDRLREYFPYPGARPSFLRPLHSARLLKARLGALLERFVSRPPRLKANDTLFVAGQFWMSPTVIKFCERAAARGSNLIVLFHDLIPITNPQFAGHQFADEYRSVLRLPAHFIVTTPFNAGELEAVRKAMGARAAAVSVIPLAEEFPGAPRNETALQPRVFEDLAKAPFVLCVGTVEVRKNHMALLSAWEELEAELGERLPRLVVAGRRGWKAEAALRRLDEVPHAHQIVFAEAPSEEELRWLYSACLFTVFPSFFEGWGLPVGESLWFGKSCAASNTSSIPAVGREFCVYFSPYNRDEIKAAVRHLLDPETRRSLERKIEAAPLRTWAEVAGDIARIIKRPPAAADEAKISEIEVRAS